MWFEVEVIRHHVGHQAKDATPNSLVTYEHSARRIRDANRVTILNFALSRSRDFSGDHHHRHRHHHQQEQEQQQRPADEDEDDDHDHSSPG